MKRIFATSVLALLIGATVAQAAEFDLSGYYRVRPTYINNLSGHSDFSPNNTGYIQQRLRLEPEIRFGEKLAFFSQIHVMDDVLWGYNYGTDGPVGYSNYEKYEPATDLFASGETNTTPGGIETDSVRWERAWVEWLTPVGLIKLGRQPSNFGMGTFSNDGGNALSLSQPDLTVEEKYNKYFDDAFGDNHKGHTYDRFLFATKPLGPSSNLLLALGYDKLVDEASGTRKGQGIHNSTDDSDQYILVIYYNGPADPVTKDQLKGGMYCVQRRNSDTRSEVYICDFHFYGRWGGLYAEDELIVMRGRSNRGGVPFTPNLNANIWLNILKLGYDTGSLDSWVEIGVIPGDDGLYYPGAPYPGDTPPVNFDNDPDPDFKSFYSYQDRNTGLLMWSEVAKYYSTGWLDSGGGPINCNYVNLVVEKQLMDDKLTVWGGLLWAQSDKAEQFRGLADDETDLGIEIDGRVMLKAHENLRVGMEAGYYMPGKGIPGYFYDEDPEPISMVRGRFTLVF